MRKYIIDFVFDEITGEAKVLIDFHDTSMTAMEINESVRSGEIREDVLKVVENMLGPQVATNIRDGKTQMICLDDHPEEQKTPQNISQQQHETQQKRENLQ